MLNMKVKIKVVSAKIRNSVQRLVVKSKCQPITIREVLCNTRGSVADIALGLVVSVVVTAIILVALKSLFNVNILPAVTDKITAMFS